MLLKNLLSGSRTGSPAKLETTKPLKTGGAVKVSLGLGQGPIKAREKTAEEPGAQKESPAAGMIAPAEVAPDEVSSVEKQAGSATRDGAEGGNKVVSLRGARDAAFSRQDASAPAPASPPAQQVEQRTQEAGKPVATAAATGSKPEEEQRSAAATLVANPGNANKNSVQPAQLKSLEQLPARFEIASGDNGKYGLAAALRKDLAVVLDIDEGKYILVVSAKQYLSAFHAAIADRIKEQKDVISQVYQADPGLVASLYSSSATSRGDASNSAQVRDIDGLIQVAIERKASDIHLTIRDSDAEIRLRINGKLVEYTRWDNQYAMAIARTLHFLSDQDTKPQVFSTSEGQSMMVTRDVGEAKVKLRVQTSNIYPSGFEVVARILRSGRNTKPMPLEDLGYAPWHVQTLNEMMRMPWGVTILAGETGSGKSTTLFTMMTSMAEADPGAKLITVEDPPEYNMERWKITQIPVTRRRSQQEDRNPFAEALRNLMRMDPDVAMVGEIRDAASAEAMVNLNRSGHKITSTIHAPNAFGIFDRLVTLGVDLPTLTSRGFISGFVSQRLVPTLCKCCRVNYDPSIDLKIPGIHERIKSVTTEGDNLYVAGEGCEQCKGTGIDGQTVLAEMIIPDGKILEMLRHGRFAEAYEYWRKFRQPRFAHIDRPMVGMTMCDHGVLKMRAGLIAPDELELSVGPMNQGIDSEIEAVVANEVADLIKL